MTAKNKIAPWVRLGDYITQRREKNSGLSLPIRGVTSDGFIPPKQLDANTMLYNVFYKKDFVFNPARMELNSIALNTDYEKAICSSLYEIFYINKPDKLLPEYLYLYIKRGEFARYCWYDAIGSARNYFRVANMQDIRIPLPSIEVQQELVDTYTGLKRLAEDNEALIAPLTEACQAFIVDCKKKYPTVELGKYIEEYNQLNQDNTIKVVKSVSVAKEFKETGAKVNKNELSGYKIVPPMFISYVQTTKNEKCFACALNRLGESIVVTSVNKVLGVRDSRKLSIEYLYLLLTKPEFDRYAIYHSWGSARETFDWTELCRVSIALPPPEVQQSIVNLYHCIEEAKKIASEARAQLQTLCPALLQYAEHN
ncbi:restriction endonuclease subunit S [Porphyromonas gingivicanis]|uniref:restriction endonuclease subunit S n=1 Tax=Porphyromonas gingivicanis TaxID=266762 RepID=UPI0004724244|nr:restriction endonuclease subunit S [Porphyromonas gingivicanis]